MIRVCEPDISEIEKKYVNQALDENELSGHGKHVKLFEERFAEYIGVKHAILVPNGTIAIHLTLAASGVSIGDEVILPSQTISTVAFCVTQLGATVVPCDVDKETWTMGMKLEECLSDKTLVAIPTPIYGGVSPDMDYIMKCCGVWTWIIEDFAEAVGSKLDCDMIGSIGDVGCCSFFANKTIAMGEGGAIVTNHDFLDEKIRYLRNCAYNREGLGDRFLAKECGFNYRPHNLQAAIGLGQLDRIEYLIGRRVEIHEWYKKYLSDKFIWQQNIEKCNAVPWMNAVLLPKTEENLTDLENRNKFMQYMKNNDIETRATFPPIGSHPYLQIEDWMLRKTDETNSEYIYENGVLLPSGGKHLTKEVIKYICETANKFVED